MNIHRTVPIIYLVLVIIICLLLQSGVAFANGAAWGLIVTTGTPGPLQQNELFMEREHVSITDETVQAKFWINNPTKKSISINIGFPITDSAGGLTGNKKIDSENLIRVKKEFVSKLEVKTSDNNVIHPEVHIRENPEYSIFYTWPMTFPPQHVTEFTVTYPSDISCGGDDVTFSSLNFIYITHTGSYWSKPIKQATIEYCSKNYPLHKFITKYKQGIYFDSDLSEQVKIACEVVPVPYDIDEKRGCIVWNRANWKPAKDEDDIKISFALTSVAWKFEPNKYLPSNDELFALWCGYYCDGKEKEHLGTRLNIDSIKLDAISIKNIERYAFGKEYNGKDCGDYSDNYYFPPPHHYKTHLQLLLIKYLKNYLFAVHGYKFKKPRLEELYEDVKAEKKWTSQAQKNLVFLNFYQNQIEKENEKARDEVKDKIIDFKYLGKIIPCNLRFKER